MTAPKRTIAERRMVCAVVNRYGVRVGDDNQPHATADSRELLLALFCTHPTDRQRAWRPEVARQTADDLAEAERMEQRRTADPAQKSDTGDVGPFRAQACAWGRENGWPHADSRQPLDPDMLAAYRAAKAGEGS